MARPKKVITQDATPDVAQDATQEPAQDNPRIEIFDTGKNIVKVAPVYGAMHHLLQDIRIEGFTEVEMDSWVEVQIEAGKLTLERPMEG